MHDHLSPPHIQERQGICIFDVRIDALTRSALQNYLLNSIRTGIRGWFCYVNVHTIEVAGQLPWFKEFFEHALIRYCDGEGVRFGAYLLGYRVPERITLSDYIYDLAGFASANGLRLFVLGGTVNVGERGVRQLKKLYPDLQLVGYHHGYFSELENNSIIQEINTSQPDILLLGMGVPKQEEWTKANFDKLNAKIVWMGGGFLDTLSGEKKQCPRWLGNIGLEWLFRLVQEPKRLWRRYLIGNPLFLLRIIQARFQRN